MEIIGKIKRILETQVLGSNGFQKRDVVIVTDEQYPQTVQLQFVQGNTTMLDNFVAGEKVKIKFNVQGKEFTNNKREVSVYTTL